MSVGSVSGAYGTFSTRSLQQAPEAAEVQQGGRDNDGDSDDGGSSAVNAALAPTVNASGQTIGQIINVTA
jgi:hypothetical protein